MTWRLKLILHMAILWAPYCAADVVGRWESPSATQECTAALVAAFDKAEKSIDVLVYNFTSEPIAAALERAAKRKVAVTIVQDWRASRQKSCQLARCAKAGCKTYTDKRHPITHYKTAVIDGKLLLNGSFNYSRSAERNAENLYAEDDPETVAWFQARIREHLAHSEPLRAARK